MKTWRTRDTFMAAVFLRHRISPLRLDNDNGTTYFVYEITPGSMKLREMCFELMGRGFTKYYHAIKKQVLDNQR